MFIPYVDCISTALRAGRTPAGIEDEKDGSALVILRRVVVVQLDVGEVFALVGVQAPSMEMEDEVTQLRVLSRRPHSG